MSELVPEHESALQEQMTTTDILGRTKLPRGTVRRARREIGEALIGELKIERAKRAAITGMLAENQARQLAQALTIDDPAALMAAGDYIRALHAIGVNQVLKAGN
ncbi:MAG: hypothetical protein R2710_21790 [Acidimicrobiales bacterium]